ncbi:MAG TPA: hypothetical protein VHN36_19890, partial [Ilumatobacteraceae bacterium]|nr:hypothetical protein [Ilumatobacteraceae bacterium]
TATWKSPTPTEPHEPANRAANQHEVHEPDVLHHFSEDPNITRFVPHVPRTNPEHQAKRTPTVPAVHGNAHTSS